MNRLTIGLALAVTLLSSTFTLAQVDGTWTGTEGSWSNPANWSSAPLFPTAGGVATFNCTTVGGEGYPSISLDTDVTLSKIDFAFTPYAPIISSTSGHTLTLVGPAEVSVAENIPGNTAIRFSIDGPSLENVAGTNGLIKRGPGTLGLLNNTYSGDTVVMDGTIQGQDDTSFGAAGGKLILYNAYLEDYDGFMDISHDIVLAGNTATVSIEQNSNLRGVIFGPGGLTVSEIQRSQLQLSGANTYTGETHINCYSGGLVVTGANGSIRNTSQISIAAGGIIIDNTGAVLNDRVGDTTPIKIDSGGIELKGNSTISTNEHVGTITVADAGFIMAIQTGSATCQLSSAALVRENFGTMKFSLPTSAFVTFDQMPALVGGNGAAGFNRAILPFAIENDPPGLNSTYTLVGYDSNGVHGLQSSEYFNGLSGATSDFNVNVGTDSIISSPVTVNALRLKASTGSGSVTLAGGGTVTVASGAVVLNNSSTVLANLNFGSKEGIIAGNGGVGGVITGSNGLTLHDGTISLTGLNTYTGTTAVRSGSINISDNIIAGVPGPLGLDTSPVIVGSGSSLYLLTHSGNTATITRDLKFEGEEGRLAFPTSELTAAFASIFNISGNIETSGVLSLSGQSGGVINVSGNITGPGAIFGISSTSTIILSGNNSMTGGVIVGGTVLAASDTAFGTGSIQFGGSIGAFGGPRTISNEISSISGLSFASGPPLTLTGKIGIGADMLGATGISEITIPANTEVTFGGPVEGGAFELASGLSSNAGTLNLTHANPGLFGPILIGTGVLHASGPMSLGPYSKLLTVRSGGSLYLSDGVETSAITSIQDGGFSNLGAVRSLSGNNAITGPVTITAPVVIGVDADSLAMPNLSTPATATASAPKLTKMGAGELVLPRFSLNTLTISAGTIEVIAHGAAPAACAVQTISLAGGFTTPNSTLDLANNGLRIDAASITLADISAAIRFARDGGAWDRAGITSSATLQQPLHITTLGTMSAADFQSIYGSSASFEGVSVPANSTLIKYTFYGDANFSGGVDGGDYARIDNTFSEETSAGDIGGWINGDFDYNGRVDGADYALIDLAFSAQSETLARALAFLDGSDPSTDDMTSPALQKVLQHYDEFGSVYASTFLTTVPEPTILATLPIVSAFLARRRRTFERDLLSQRN